ncbi:MAG: YihY family inner membrane protein [Methylococcaceae bacterium]|nr:YihY family inner membrane protein [Methylococcaceae bacterium]MCI0668586.1 YihY family inner membrane protein [Methylococcaceae bacterium]
MPIFNTLKHYLPTALWNPKRRLPRNCEKFLANAMHGGLILIREATQGDLRYLAMGLVYTTLLSLAPILAVGFSVLKSFGVHNQIKPLLLNVLAPLGDQGTELADLMISYVENIQIGVLGAAGMFFLLYSVISLVKIIEECFNRIWRTHQSRSWVRRFNDFLSTLLVGPVLVFSAIGVMASMANTQLAQSIIAIEPFGSVYYLAGRIVPYVLIIAAFTFLYRFIPNTRVNLGSALTGGIFGGLAWKTVGWMFGIFVGKSASYNAIYSSFAIILLSMIWLYLSWLTLLLGGIISFLHQHPCYLLHQNRNPVLSHRQQEMLGFLIMYLIGKAHYEGNAPWTLFALADAVDLPWESVRHLLQVLEQAGLLVSIRSEPDAFLPARALETISLKEIYITMRTFDERMRTVIKGPPFSDRVTDLAMKVENSSLGVLDGLSLHDLIREEHLVPVI